MPLVAALVAILLLALHTSASTPCSEATAQLDNGFLESAEKQFDDMLADDPESKCASDGMESIATKKCAQAGKELKADLVRRALKTYQGIVGPGSKCAKKGIAAVVVRLCKWADDLRQQKVADAAAEVDADIVAIEPLPEITDDCPAETVVVPPGEPKTVVIQGADGQDGTDGNDGTDGKDGTNGRPGEPGKDGADGRPGKPGKDGRDGEVIVLDGKG